MVFRIIEDAKKSSSEQMTQDEMIKMVSDFSRGLILWESNGGAWKWIDYRKQCANGDFRNLILLEDIIYEMRKKCRVEA